ncbi:MAG TPA: hypothetical protein DIU15_08650 [Deltaproteobacteria bacterium]|nr:hypothetical protein [Deltaproteobacteria bacterium]HCP46096.1 hypothetical protein [Deltaproteobacteria bacterium]
MCKAQLLQRWRTHLESKRDALLNEQAAARSATRVDGGHRPENRGERAAVTSQGYLAEALASRTDDLDAAIQQLDAVGAGPRERVSLGALVVVEDENGRESRFLLLPGGDASHLDSARGPVRVLSPSSPIAAALMGLDELESAEFIRGDHLVEWTIQEVL